MDSRGQPPKPQYPQQLNCPILGVDDPSVQVDSVDPSVWGPEGLPSGLSGETQARPQPGELHRAPTHHQGEHREDGVGELSPPLQHAMGADHASPSPLIRASVASTTSLGSAFRKR